MAVLGLDIGGANLKAATADRRAVSAPFALWKQSDRLPAALAELVGRFPDADELAVTMTGELCDCFETKRQGVDAILRAVANVSRSRPVRVWSTDGAFLTTTEARANHLKVASANWHALATLAGQYVPHGPGTLIDVGSTTTDVIPLLDGIPIPRGKTDPERLERKELIYSGVRRTPVCAVTVERVARELFATTLDVYLVLGMVPEDPNDTDTADGRPATRRHAFDRLCRMWCGDRDTITPERVEHLANDVVTYQSGLLREGFDSTCWAFHTELDKQGRKLKKHQKRVVVACGSGEFLAQRVLVGHEDCKEVLSLTDRLGPAVSACAPAYAVAVLAAERR
jgi:probable H4MPT-linked C1 transfer pathway protein